MKIHNEAQFDDALEVVIDRAFEAVDAGDMTKETIIAILEEQLQKVRDGEYDKI